MCYNLIIILGGFKVKKEIINIRVTKEEKEIISRKAKEMGMSASQYIRYIILYKVDDV